MRLKMEKIDELTEKIFQVIQADSECQFVRDEQMIKDSIRDLIIGDLKREDDVEQEIWDKLEAHNDQIQNRSVSRNDLYVQAKRMIARERDLIF